MNKLTLLKNITTCGLIIFSFTVSCKTGIKSERVSIEKHRNNIINPPVIIYKTRKDYFNNVPVLLSNDKLSVSAYPDKADIYHDGELATPTLLANGYLLDNRGISENSAFVKYTYREYSQLTSTPSAETLFSMVIDADPFTEIYSCQCTRDTFEIDRIIKEGLIRNCKKIK
jgi:hypothetical protein